MIIVRRAGLAGKGASRTAGFTLIEILVALAISGLCLMMLSGIVGRLAAARRAVYDHAAALDQGEAVKRMLRNLLASVDTEMKDAEISNVRGGSADLFMRSVGPAVLDLGTETAFHFHLVHARDSQSGALALAWTNPTTGVSFDETLASGVLALRLAYKGKGRIEDWVDRWERPVAELALVKAEITFAAPRGATSTIFAVGTRLPQACVVDPLLDRCPQW